MRSMPEHPQEADHLIAGVDEVGRGPLAGPVIAAAVILKHSIGIVKDSKKISPQRREALVPVIQAAALAYAYGRAEAHEIDTLNIHHATLLAMQRAVAALSITPTTVWVDGCHAPQLSMPTHTLIKGDEKMEVIACASILAKVLRDQEMIALSLEYPHYGFEQHKGYPTPLHLQQLKLHGPMVLHRRSFKPVAECCS